ncbi:MAG: hypothetical protein PW845_14515 [Pseudomonas sp.]|uniref:hypothetical protein n=1 Tax=Pseudomonas abieticivorans TaxID=2931382 RepID=UPI0020C0ECDB|nr:hypothetical protein [Pseudomonas sp. PIA16]MDE1166555.1 hypothetical protein [Pseudomonas sp.]
MRTFDKGIFSLLLLATAISSTYGLTAQAAGDGVVVIQREVQPRVATRPTMVPDPNPTTVNTNPSALVTRVTSHELSDGDFAGISSGNSITRTIMPDGNLRGLGGAQQQLPGMSAGHGGGSGNSISNTVNQAVTQGLSPLRMLSGDR